MRILLVLFAILVHTARSELLVSLHKTEEPTTLSLEIKNMDTFAVGLLRWDLPLDRRFGGNTFGVYFDGQPVPYIGAVVKYADPTLTDYIVLYSNETITVPVVLHNFYDFSKIGSYKVMFQSYVMDFVQEPELKSIPRLRENFSPSEILLSNPVVISITRPYPKEEVVAPYPCSTSERNIILDAAQSLVTLVNRARTVINQGSSPTYTEWLGAYTTGRWQIAEEVIRLIQGNNRVAYQCDDMPNVYAYVYPGDSTHTIYVCSAFWNSNKIGGWDTQSGTLLHELSHFNDIGGTSDWAYGTSACRNLARTNPERAVNNADNYEYFSESQFP